MHQNDIDYIEAQLASRTVNPATRRAIQRLVECVRDLEDVEDDAGVDVSDMTVGEIRELVAGISDLQTLEELHDDETTGKSRVTAVEAIEERIAALDEEE